MNSINIPKVPLQALDKLSEASSACIERLQLYDLERPDLSGKSRSKLAAVLVLLYDRSGELRVLLTTRSKALRTHAGQTALPGGKVDDTDGDIAETAYREAYEEVGLPLNSPDIHTVCILEPFISLHRLLVTPIVALLSDTTILENLKAAKGEVAHIFDHPLEALLDPTLAQSEPLVSIGSEDWIYDSEYHNTSDVTAQSLGNMVYRMHRFRSMASPIKGLTSDILIKAAEIAYGKCPTYERYSPDQKYGFDAISHLVEERDPLKQTTSVGSW